MHSPFASADPVARRGGIILGIVTTLFMACLLATVVVEAKTQTLQTSVILPAKSWYTTRVHLMALEMAKVSREQQESALYEQQLIEARTLEQEFLKNDQKNSVEVNSQTTITNDGVTVKKQKTVKKTNPTPAPVPQETETWTYLQYQESPQQPTQTTPQLNQTFDQQAWDAQIARMKAESEARYQESLKNQQAWSDQKSAENQAWLEEQSAKAQAEQEKWRQEQGL